MKLEVVVIPVSDVDRAKRFYGSLGWRLDADFAIGNDFRVVQFTPPGSPCSIHFGTGVTSAAPGSAQGLYLVVSDIEAARAELVGRGVDASEVFHAGPGESRPTSERSSPDPQRRHLRLVRHVQRSGRQPVAAPGDQDAASRARTQQRGRSDSDRASERDRAAPWRVRTDRSEAPLVGVVRRLHRRARARPGSRGSSRKRRCAPYGRCPPPVRARHRSRRSLPGLRAFGPPRQAPLARGVAGRRPAGAGVLARRFLSKRQETTRRAPATPPRDAGRLLPPRDHLDRQPARRRTSSAPASALTGRSSRTPGVNCRRISTSRNTPTRTTIR